MCSRSWIVLPAVAAVTMALTLGLCAALAPDPGALAQHYQLRLCEERLPRVQTLLRADPRFANVDVGMNSSPGGLTVGGFVETPDDLFRLMRAIAAEQLPVPVSWKVYVTAEQIGR